MKYIGAHVSSSGGVENAPLNAKNIGAKAFALFTKNQRQWKSKELTEESILKFKENVNKLGFLKEMILPHDSYLINIGSPEKENFDKSYEAFLDELKRAEQLGLLYLNIHPGSHLNMISEEESMEKIAFNINRALKETAKISVILENTAGQGTNIGYKFEQLKSIIDMVEDKNRIGVCIDTCHMFAAGYDIRTEYEYKKTIEEFEKKVGINYLKAMHINDSKSEFGSRVDRHHSIGKGNIGIEAFKLIMNDKRMDNIPLILETTEPEIWHEEIQMLYGFIK